MARKNLTSNLPLNEQTTHQVLDAIKEMIETHSDQIQETVEESDKKCATVTFGVELDCSESAPTIDVKMRFSSSVTDRRTIRCEDPNQITFTDSIVPPAEVPNKKRKKKGEEAAEEGEPAGDGESAAA